MLTMLCLLWIENRKLHILNANHWPERKMILLSRLRRIDSISSIVIFLDNWLPLILEYSLIMVLIKWNLWSEWFLKEVAQYNSSNFNSWYMRKYFILKSLWSFHTCVLKYLSVVTQILYVLLQGLLSAVELTKPFNIFSPSVHLK